MIVKRNFNPVRIWQYIKNPMRLVIIWSLVVWAIFYVTESKYMAINFTPIAIIGSALAIFIAFRNNSAYGRWWEARKIWSSLVNHSREYARMIINFVDVCIRANPDRKNEMNAFKKQLIYAQIAFINALRIHLRKQKTWSDLGSFLVKGDLEKVLNAHNKPNMINMLSGDALRKGQDAKMLEWYHTFQIESNLTQFAHHLGNCERIKNTPLPRQYDFFTRIFVVMFSLLIPFGMLSFFDTESMKNISWVSSVLSILISGVFIVMERTGAANEDPFENKITDVPMTSLCNTIERDLKEMLGESDLPQKMIPENGYIY